MGRKLPLSIITAMIQSVSFKGCGYIKAVKREIQFTKGLNVICGENATGKSIILRSILAVEPDKEETKFADWEVSSKKKEVVVKSDEHTNVVKFDQSEFIGANLSQSRMAHLDYTRFVTTVMNSKSWSGAERFANYYTWFFDQYQHLANSNLTIIMDEPENSNSLKTLQYIFGDYNSGMLRWIALGCQVIVASHNPYICSLANNLIELQKGYVSAQINAYSSALEILKEKVKCKR